VCSPPARVPEAGRSRGRIAAGAHIDDTKFPRDAVAAVFAFTVHGPAPAGVTFELIQDLTAIERTLTACRPQRLT
jgi:hypothetical protein